MNDVLLRQLADQRLDDARVLLAAGHWSAVYYLAGYAVECALKVCVLKHVLNTGVIFTDRKFVEKCWTHNIDDLVKAAGLEVERGLEMAANPARESNWVTVRRWSEVARYNLTTRTDAEELYNAIADPTNGVLPWIKSRW